MEPSKKSQPLTDMLEALTGRTTAITSNACINPPYGCGKPAIEFRDAVSTREFAISGFCQACQDAVFGVSALKDAVFGV